MRRLGRRGLFALLVVVCAGVAAGVVIVSRDSGTTAGPVSQGAQVPDGDVVLFRSLDGYSLETFGKVGYSEPASRPAGRSSSDLDCERVHFGGGRGICLQRTGAVSYVARVFDSRFATLHQLDLGGLPSRTRVSPDGRYGAVTAFTAGHSYARAGQFSTETQIVDLTSGRPLGNLEEFRVERDGRAFKSIDFNFWGVTFSRDSDRFFASLGTRGTTYLVEGEVSARRMRVVRENVECPSLSPDGTRIAFKKRMSSRPGDWRFHVLDLATLQDRPLAETRSIDDQLEWLDDETVLYGVTEEIWALRADGSGEPSRFIDGADSPAVVRTGAR